MGEQDKERLSFLHRRLPLNMEHDVITIAAGTSRPFVPGDWSDALVVVEEGELRLEFKSGTIRHFAAGDVLWLGGLSLRAIHSGGSRAAVLSAVRRRRDSGTPDDQRRDPRLLWTQRLDRLDDVLTDLKREERGDVAGDD